MEREKYIGHRKVMKEIKSKSLKEATLFQVTNQAWKMQVFYFLGIIMLAMFGASLTEDLDTQFSFSEWLGLDDGTISFITTVFAAFVWLPWTMFSLRCPRCNKAMVWYIMKNKDQAEFASLFAHLLHVGCPACHLEYRSLLNDDDNL